MIPQRLLMAILVVALIGAGCAKPYNPFVRSRDQIYRKVETIAVAPIAVPEDLEVPQPVKAMFESLIEAKLLEAGFSIVPSIKYTEIWQRMTKQVGEYFDPVTGKRDESKLRAVRKDCLRELSNKCNANAVVYLEIRVVTVGFSSGRVKWHGTSENLGTGGPDTFFLGNYSGRVPALSLFVTIKDTDDVHMYVNRGGIQLLEKAMIGFPMPKFLPVPEDQLFSKEERNAAAVNIALEPLLTKPETR